MENNNSVQADNVPGQSAQSTINEGTTEMITNTTIVEPQYPTKLTNYVSRSHFPNDVSTIIHYLNKPIPVTSGAWGTGSTAGTLLYSQDAWVGVWANVMWKEKLHGFYGLRATLRVDLVLNATPFHAGRLRLCYYPSASSNLLKMNMHLTHRTPLSQLPGLDIGCGDESISLKIPYVTPQRFIELTSAIQSWGQIVLTIMSPLNTGAASDSTVDYTMWYSMEDVELFGQSNRAVNQQSLPGKGRPKRINATESELKPLSHTLGAAADFAGMVGQIPFLTPWAGPVSWFLNAVKGAAIAFGFCKPINTEVPCLMSSNYNWHATTADGVDNSVPLALLYDAKLKLLDDVTAGGEDQMSINFIKSQWAYLESFTIAESNTLGQSLYRLDYSPRALRVGVSAQEFYYTPIGYLSNLYSVYRGGYEVMFKLIKTGFHAGSIAISFVPGPHDASLSLTDTSYVYRTVLDLQEGDEACFTVPYLLPLDFIDTNISLGAIYVNVVNPLRSPDTCANNVDVLVYIRGARDFQVNVPRAWTAYPITQQGGDVDHISEDIVCSPVGESPSANLDYNFCQDAISETATSLLQLAKRFNYITIQYANAATDNVIQVFPWTIGCSRFFAATLSTPRGVVDATLAQVTAPFAFYRGGIRWRFNPTQSGEEDNVVYMNRNENVGGGNYNFVTTGVVTDYVLNNTDSLGIGYPPTILPIANNRWSHGGLSVSVPFQSVYRMAPIQYAHLTTSQTDFFSPRARLRGFIGTSRNRLITRAVADDFQCLFWVGIPRMDA